MLVGVPKEIKNHEYRVGLIPASVKELIASGHQVIVETNAGAGIDFPDDDYRAAGAEIVATAKEVFDRAGMIVKVKEPQPQECKMLKEGQLLFTYLIWLRIPRKPNCWFSPEQPASLTRQ